MLFEWVNKRKLTFEQGFEARYIYLLSQIVSLALFSKWENWGSEQLNDLLDVSQWVSRGVRNQGLWIPKSRLCYAFVHSFHKELMRDHSLPGLLLHFFPPFPHVAKTAKTTLSANSLPILYIHLPGTSSWNPDWVIYLIFFPKRSKFSFHISVFPIFPTGLEEFEDSSEPHMFPIPQNFLLGVEWGGHVNYEAWGVQQRTNHEKGLFNHVKRLGLYPTGSQESGKGFKPLKYHHLSDRQSRVLTGKWEGLAGETGKQIHMLGETNPNESLLADNGALHSLLGSPPLTSCASMVPMTFLSYDSSQAAGH